MKLLLLLLTITIVSLLWRSVIIHEGFFKKSFRKVSKVTKQVTKPIAKVTKQVAKPIAKITQPIAKVTQPIAKVAKQVAKQVAKPIAKVTQPIAKVAKQVAKPIAKVAKQVAKPIAKVAKQIAKPITKIGKQIAKPMTKIGKPKGKSIEEITSRTVTQPEYGVVIIQDQLKLLNEVQGKVQKIPSYKIQPKDRMEINKSLNIVINSLKTWLNDRMNYIKAYNKKPDSPSENQSIDKLREIWVNNGMGLKLIITGIIERLDVTNDLQLDTYNILQKFNEKMNMELGVTLSEPSTTGYEPIRPVENVFNDSGRTFDNKLLQYFF
jgi:histone H3/H4